MASRAWSWRNTAGRVRPDLGTCRRVAGSLGSNPRRSAQAVKVLSAEVRRASVVRAAPAAAWAASQDRSAGRVRLLSPASGVRCGEKVEQRPQIAEVRTAGVLGAATFQREVFVELLEDRLHSPTVADAGRGFQVTRRSVSGVRSASVG